MSMRPQAALLVKGGPGDGNTIMLSLGITVIGRTQPNDIVVDDPGVSRQHASIRGDACGYSITDLSSRNGTSWRSVPNRMGARSVKIDSYRRPR